MILLISIAAEGVLWFVARRKAKSLNEELKRFQIRKEKEN